MKTAGIAALLASALLATPAAAFGYAAFRTPGHAAYCGPSEGEGPASLICWTPNDGFTVVMTARGHPRKFYVAGNKGLHNDLARMLPFGGSWLQSGFRCASRSNGLTCTNRAGHGWWLGRYRGYRLF